ncbi:MAG: dihydropteroate synthase [Lachnospiraceae bacterium]|nr:dihydropteroate synthase [Lachnospiraceae bacterium]MBR3762117.1 dihydropteroate synthase [Lachnospiraceae bacterium]
MKIGSKIFDLSHKTYIMGILNVTPDSFSDGGKFSAVDQALFHVEEMLRDGCDIVDIGGESTRPGFTFVPVEEEIARVVPVIKAIKARFDVPVSLDTYKYQVAETGIEAGADLINDIWGLKYDEGQMAQVIAKAGVACCLMHNRKETVYRSFIPEVLKDLQESANIALKAGISQDKIILDPGVGFAKTYEQNLEVLRHLQDFNTLGYPMLLGTSRKSVIGLTLDLPADEREEGTLVTTVQAVQAGWNFVRVHNVKGNARAIKMTEAIYGSN